MSVSIKNNYKDVPLFDALETYLRFKALSLCYSTVSYIRPKSGGHTKVQNNLHRLLLEAKADPITNSFNQGSGTQRIKFTDREYLEYTAKMVTVIKTLHKYVSLNQSGLETEKKSYEDFGPKSKKKKDERPDMAKLMIDCGPAIEGNWINIGDLHDELVKQLEEFYSSVDAKEGERTMPVVSIVDEAKIKLDLRKENVDGVASFLREVIGDFLRVKMTGSAQFDSLFKISK